MKIRVAASSYLNSAPLIWSFLHGPHEGSVDFVEAVPARCAQLLAQSSVEVALVPVIEYQRIAGGSLVPNVCVGSRKEVLSVVLVSKNKRLQDIRTVALDESSRTSATLVKIIFREFLDREPEWTTRAPDLDAMLDQLRAAGVQIDDRVEQSEFGRFGWAIDPEGNRFELWQPPDKS